MRWSSAVTLHAQGNRVSYGLSAFVRQPPGVYKIRGRGPQQTPLSRLADQSGGKYHSRCQAAMLPALIHSVEAYTAATSGAIVTPGVDVYIVEYSSMVDCLPKILTVDCGPDSVGDRGGLCRYNSVGAKLVMVTLEQLGVVVFSSINIAVVEFDIGISLASGNPLASVGERILVEYRRYAAECAPYSVTRDYGPDIIVEDIPSDVRPPVKYGDYVRYTSPGQKTFTCTLTQSGVTVTRTHNITVTTFYPTCPASPDDVYAFNVTVTKGPKPFIRQILITPESGNPAARVGEDIFQSCRRVFQPMSCLPCNVVIDCGADSVGNVTGIGGVLSVQHPWTEGHLRYRDGGWCVGLPHLEHYDHIFIHAFYACSIRGPYSVPLCSSVFVGAAGPRPLFNASTMQLHPGVYPTSMQARAETGTWPGSVTIILTTDVTVTGGNTVGERIQISVSDKKVKCFPFNVTIDCGLDHVGQQGGLLSVWHCRRECMSVTLSQSGVEVSRTLNVTMIATTPSCMTPAFPEGRRIKHFFSNLTIIEVLMMLDEICINRNNHDYRLFLCIQSIVNRVGAIEQVGKSGHSTAQRTIRILCSGWLSHGNMFSTSSFSLPP
eukprot:jgi/Chlat1/1938/Chrsp153S02243